MTPLADAVLDDLDVKARAATPGPWESLRNLDWNQPLTEVRHTDSDKQVVRFVRGEPRFSCTTGKAEEEWANADFIAVASPDVVEKLVAEVREHRAMKARMADTDGITAAMAHGLDVRQTLTVGIVVKMVASLIHWLSTGKPSR